MRKIHLPTYVLIAGTFKGMFACICVCVCVCVCERERERVKRKITNALVRVTILISK